MNSRAYILGYIDKKASAQNALMYGLIGGGLSSAADAGIRLAAEKLVHGKGWGDLTPEERSRFIRENLKTMAAGGLASGTIGAFTNG